MNFISGCSCHQALPWWCLMEPTWCQHTAEPSFPIMGLPFPPAPTEIPSAVKIESPEAVKV